MKLGAWSLSCLMLLAGCDPGPPRDDIVDVVATATPGETEWCDLTRDEEPIGECTRFERQYDALDAGVDAFKPAELMTAGEPTIVTYAITRLPDSVQGDGGELAEPVTAETPGETAATPDGPTQEEIDTALAESGEVVSGIVVARDETGSVTVGQIKMGRRMYACLMGDPSFRIEPEACRTIDTLEQPQAVWRWTVTPTVEGEDLKLNLTSGIELRASDGTIRRIGYEGRTAEIDVRVTALERWKRFLAAAEEWVRSPLGLIAALTALAGAIGLLIVAVRRARRDEAQPGGKEEGPGSDPGET